MTGSPGFPFTVTLRSASCDFPPPLNVSFSTEVPNGVVACVSTVSEPELVLAGSVSGMIETSFTDGALISIGLSKH